jgi:serine protease
MDEERVMSGRLRFSVSVAGFLLLAGFAVPTAALPDDGSGLALNQDYVEGEVLVRIAPGTDPALLGRGIDHIFGNWYVVPTRPLEKATDAMERMGAQSHIEVVELNRIWRLDPMPSQQIESPGLAAVTPNDPLYSYQWHLPAIDAGDAWEVTDGSGVVVAVVDSGISMGGDDLDCRPLAGEYNAFTDASGPGAALDDVNHGTHVAGTIGQCTNNGVGVAGVASGTSLLAARSFRQAGGTTTTEIAKGIDWARTQGADVINMSFRGPCSPTPTVTFDALDAAVADGIVLVAATGNDAEESWYLGDLPSPACHPGVIAVGATDFNGNRSPYSNWGTGIDVAAPGGDMGADANGDGSPDGVLQETFSPSDPLDWGYWWMDGTSMAAPHVSGTAALMIAANSSVTPSQVKRALEVTAEDRGSAGWDMYYGHGLIDADAAIDAVQDTQEPSWPSGSTVSVTPGETTANLSWAAAADNIAVTDYMVWLDGSPVASTTTNSHTLTGLSPATTYSVAVQAGDLMENWTAVGSPTSFYTTGTADTEAPQWGGGAAIDAIIGDDWVYLSWDDASDNVGVTAYRVVQDGSVVLTTASSYADVEGLTEGTTYSFRIEAGDAAGNWSSNGPVLQVTTEDWSLPEWPAGSQMHATNVLEDRATLSWTTATDPSGIAKYEVYVDGEYHTTTGTSLTVTGLDPGTEYMTWVDAYDPSGNWSIGPEMSFTTALDFADTDGSTFENDIAWLSGAGITKGCNPPLNTNFCPESYVTRGQMAAFMVRALGYTDRGAGDLFGDDDDSVFEADIDKLAVAGVTRGCNPPANTKFCPESYVTRGQMAAFMVRALSYADRGPGDLFGDDDDSVFEADIDKLAVAGVTRGCNPPANTNFCPDSRVSRGQMAAFLHRALG